MTLEKDERKRSHLRLVVDNPDKRGAGAGKMGESLPLNTLVAMREEFRPLFYKGMEPKFRSAYEKLERLLDNRGWHYGLDYQNGPLLVLPAELVCPEAARPEEKHPDEIVFHMAEDGTGAVCFSLEMILPFYSEDEAVMEDVLLYSPVFQYGTIFLEENQQDQGLDLIYRLGFPLYPPALTSRLFERMLAIARFELREILRVLAEYPEEE